MNQDTPETHTIEEAIPVIGMIVSRFPEGIGEAFDKLATTLPSPERRYFYGICEMTAAGLVYKAAAQALPLEVEARTGYERFVIRPGTYLAVPIHGWRTHIESINEAFHQLALHPKADHQHPIVECYINDSLMYCLAPMLPATT